MTPPRIIMAICAVIRGMEDDCMMERIMYAKAAIRIYAEDMVLQGDPFSIREAAERIIGWGDLDDHGEQIVRMAQWQEEAKHR